MQFEEKVTEKARDLGRGGLEAGVVGALPGREAVALQPAEHVQRVARVAAEPAPQIRRVEGRGPHQVAIGERLRLGQAEHVAEHGILPPDEVRKCRGEDTGLVASGT